MPSTTPPKIHAALIKARVNELMMKINGWYFSRPNRRQTCPAVSARVYFPACPLSSPGSLLAA
jgi:hypothetical protein